MNYSKDPLGGYIRDTILIILLVAIPIVLRITGMINMKLVWYIVLNIGLALGGFILYAILYSNIDILIPIPIYTICFIILKLNGILLLGWGWIAIALVIDALLSISCRSSTDEMHSQVY